MNNSSQSRSASAAVVRPTHGLVSRIRNYFLTGLIVAGPVAVTLWLIWWFVTWVDNLVRPLIPVAYRPETYLPVNVPGLGLIIAFIALTLLGFLTANLIGGRLVSFGESLLQPDADRAADLPHHQADLPDAVLQLRFELPARRPRRIPGAGHVVARVPEPCAKRVDRRATAADRACVGFHAVHAESDHRFLLLRAARRRGHSRHYRRAGNDADHVGGHRAARRRSAEQACGAGGDGPCRAGGATAVPAPTAAK